MEIPFYYAVFQHQSGDISIIVQENSHPFIQLSIYKETNLAVCNFWKEISKEEFEYFKNHLKD